MSGRSDELRRQRDLLREHLAWIERELAAEDSAPARPPQLVASPPPIPAPSDPADAEAILAEYRRQPVAIATQTKFGCILYFAAAMGLLVLAVGAFYFLTRGR